jgi:hypothetical protein
LQSTLGQEDKKVLDRGLGKAPQAISVDLMMGKQLSDMSQEELLEFKALIRGSGDRVVAARAPKQ